MLEIERRRRQPQPVPKPAPVPARRKKIESVRPLEHLDWIDAEMATSFHGGSQPRSSRATMAWSMAAFAIDLLAVTAMVCFFLLLSLVMQKLGWADFRWNRELIGKTFLPVFLLIDGAYLIFLRLFLGGTLGEWACGLRLGQIRQRLSSRYSLLVLARFAIVLGTGLIVLPLLSFVTGKDWAGKLSGLPLISVSSKD
jgi:hypothetical protein